MTGLTLVPLGSDREAASAPADGSTGVLARQVLRAVAEAPRAELPFLVGALAQAQAVAVARLTTPEAPASDASPVEDRNVSVGEAARRLGVSRPYLYKHAGEYPFARRIGKRLLFSSQGLDAWNRGQRPVLTARRLDG